MIRRRFIPDFDPQRVRLTSYDRPLLFTYGFKINSDLSPDLMWNTGKDGHHYQAEVQREYIHFIEHDPDYTNRRERRTMTHEEFRKLFTKESTQ